MAEFSANAVQIVNPGESVIFTDTPVPCNCGLIRHREGTGEILLSGATANQCKKSAKYFADFGANISVPAGGTAGEISLAIALDGVTLPVTTMTVTPAAVDQYFNVSRNTNVLVWKGCCENISVRNISSQPIQVQNANLVIEP